MTRLPSPPTATDRPTPGAERQAAPQPPALSKPARVAIALPLCRAAIAAGDREAAGEWLGLLEGLLTWVWHDRAAWRRAMDGRGRLVSEFGRVFTAHDVIGGKTVAELQGVLW